MKEKLFSDVENKQENIPTFRGISLCLAVLLQLKVARRAVTVQYSFVCMAASQLQCFGVTANSTLHVSCLEKSVSFLFQGGGVLK